MNRSAAGSLRSKSHEFREGPLRLEKPGYSTSSSRPQGQVAQEETKFLNPSYNFDGSARGQISNISDEPDGCLTTSYPDFLSDSDKLTNLSKKRPLGIEDTSSTTVAKRQKTRQLPGKINNQIVMAETTYKDSTPQYFEPEDSGFDRFPITHIMRLGNVTENQPRKAGNESKKDHHIYQELSALRTEVALNETVVSGFALSFDGGYGLVILDKTVLRTHIFFELREWVYSDHFKFVIGFEDSREGPLSGSLTHAICSFRDALSPSRIKYAALWDLFTKSFAPGLVFEGYPSSIIIYRDRDRISSVVSRMISQNLEGFGDWGHRTLYKCPGCSGILPPSLVEKDTSGDVAKYRYRCPRCHWYPHDLWLLPPPGSYGARFVNKNSTISQKKSDPSELFYTHDYTPRATSEYDHPLNYGESGTTSVAEDNVNGDYVAQCFEKWLKTNERSILWERWLTTERGRAHSECVAAAKEGRDVPQLDSSVWKADSFWVEWRTFMPFATRKEKRKAKSKQFKARKRAQAKENEKGLGGGEEEGEIDEGVAEVHVSQP